MIFHPYSVHSLDLCGVHPVELITNFLVFRNLIMHLHNSLTLAMCIGGKFPEIAPVSCKASY